MRLSHKGGHAQLLVLEISLPSLGVALFQVHALGSHSLDQMEINLTSAAQQVHISLDAAVQLSNLGAVPELLQMLASARLTLARAMEFLRKPYVDGFQHQLMYLGP